MWFNATNNEKADSTKSPEKAEHRVEIGSITPVRAIAKDGDLAAQYAAEGEIELTPEVDRRIRRKADMYIMPIVCVVYGLQFADKIIPSSGAMLGLTDDLFADSKTGFSWVGSSFYLGYIVNELPMSYLMQKVDLATYCGILAVVWGIVLVCTAACQNMASFLACRVLLGMLECGVQPAFTVVVTQWYKRNELFGRTCLWYAGNGFGGMFVLLISYGLRLHSQNNPHAYPLSPWRIVYIIMGCITIGMGALLWWWLPSTPHQARFLTEEEKRMQIERIRHNNQGFGSRHIKLYQIKEAVLDVRTWLYGCSYILGTIPNGGLTVFSTLILNGMGYSDTDSLLMNLPQYAVEFAGMIIMCVFSSFFLRKTRLFYCMLGSALGVMSLALIAWGPNTNSQLAGINLYAWSGVMAGSGFIAMIESDSAGWTKKVTTNAIFLMSYCAGNMIGPQVFFKREAPGYITGKKTMAGAQAGQFVLICVLAVLNVVENRRRDRKGITAPPSDIVNAEFADLTDKEMPWFRYSY